MKSVAEEDRELIVAAGRVGAHCYLHEPGGKKDLIDKSPAKDIATTVAEKAGYVTVVPNGKDSWQVTLTEKGKASLGRNPYYGHEVYEGCDFQNARFAVARNHIVDVTGVTPLANNGTTCEAEYSWLWIPTELGKALQVDGSVYKQLTQQQRDDLRAVLNLGAAGERLEVPVPDNKDLSRNKFTFRKVGDGWYML
ncbi:MAG TPA: hypothetical protein VN176_18955 [Verrucomicrobiae bacterium]|nr:hypothetical protein [Verrucomicrobiae bacterium]